MEKTQKILDNGIDTTSGQRYDINKGGDERGLDWVCGL